MKSDRWVSGTPALPSGTCTSKQRVLMYVRACVCDGSARLEQLTHTINSVRVTDTYIYLCIYCVLFQPKCHAPAEVSVIRGAGQ